MSTNIFNVNIFTWLGILFIAIGTIGTFIGQQINSDNANKEISEKTNAIRNLSEQNIKLSAEIANMAKRNAELSDEIVKFMISSDSFCYILPMPDEISDRETFMLFHEGDYPLYDVVVEIEDRNIMRELPFKPLYDEIKVSHANNDAKGERKQRDLSNELENLRSKAIKRFPLGTIPPHTAFTLDRFLIPNTSEMAFFVTIITRNAYFTETIVQKKVNDEWKSSWRVLKQESNGEIKTVKEQISKEVALRE